MTQAEGWLDYAALQLHDDTKAAMPASEVRLERRTGDLRQMSGDLLTRQRLRAEHLSALLPEAVRNFLARQATRLDIAAELIAGRSPDRILRLGFAVVRTGGKAVVSARDVSKGDALEIEVADGPIHGAEQRSEPK